MSAFIVEDSNIQEIVSYMLTDTSAKEAWQSLSFLGMSKDKPEVLAQAMLDLNYDSVNQRYEDNDAPHKITYINKPINGEAAIENLRHFTYQACEGDCMEKPLYKVLEEYKELLKPLVATEAAEQAKVQRVENVEIMRLSKPHLKEAGKYSGGKQCAKNLRIELKMAFKGIKFSVTSSYSSVNVAWTDGPTLEQVEAIANRYQEGNFNGMEDIYEYNSTPFNEVFGGCQYVFCSRDDSPTAIEQAIDTVFNKYDLGTTPKPTVEDFNQGSCLRVEFANIGRSLSQLIREACRPVYFTV